MKKIYYIIFLFFVFASHLFSQNEGNENIIKRDTVIKIDTIIVPKIDTVVITKIDTIFIDKLTSEQSNVIDSSSYLYNDVIEKIADDNTNGTDILKKEKTGIVLMQVGTMKNSWGRAFSVGVPFYNNFYVTAKYADAVSERHSIYAIAVGFCEIGQEGIFKISTGVCYMDSRWVNKNWVHYTDIGLYYRISKYVTMSFNIDWTLKGLDLYSLGLGITPKFPW